MTSAVTSAPHGGSQLLRSRNPGSQLLRDLAAVVLLALTAVAAGLIVNHFSSSPLPLVYQTPEQRFDAELNTMVAAPPFKLPPAATIGLDQFRSAVDDKSTLIFDARPSAFFENGHVPGALNLARDNFAHDYRRLTSVLQSAHDKPIIVYCSGGDCHDSRLVANALVSLGFSNVRVFTGGWDEWSAAGLPAVKGGER
jgi:rhodanese-related sulfurtransferase